MGLSKNKILAFTSKLALHTYNVVCTHSFIHSYRIIYWVSSFFSLSPGLEKTMLYKVCTQSPNHLFRISFLFRFYASGKKYSK